MITAKKIQDHINNTPMINRAEIARLIDVKPSFLSEALNPNNKRAFSKETAFKCLQALATGEGCIIDGWICRKDTDTPTVFMTYIEGDIKSIEIDGGFEYHLKAYKDFISDFWDLQ